MRPDDRCIGGALQIEAEFRNMQRRICQATPKVKTGKTHKRQGDLDNATRLSVNRAKKKSLSDLTTWNHFSNLYHLQRRIKEQSTVTERKKNPFDVEVYPTVIHRRHSATRKQPYMSYKSYHARRPFTRVPSETVFSLYRDSILRSIAEEEAPTEERVKQIFKTYIMESPSHHRHTILRVIDYISSELEI